MKMNERTLRTSDSCAQIGTAVQSLTIDIANINLLSFCFNKYFVKSGKLVCKLCNRVAALTASVRCCQVVADCRMSYNVNEICRVCLVSTTSRQNSNLFFCGGRSVQLWAKVMACAWVQVFEGDGLPSQICYKCHNRLDIAYQFKQQCEAADAHIRQLLSRNCTNEDKNQCTTIDPAQNQPDCLGECKPFTYNITDECLDLAQTEFPSNSFRINQEVPTAQQQIECRLRETDMALMKHEPVFVNNVNTTIYNGVSHPKNDCQMSSSSFKCETFNENNIILDNIPTKLFETVDERTTQLNYNNEPKPVWDTEQKITSNLLSNDKNDFNTNLENKDDNQNKDDTNKDTESDIPFLADDPIITKIVQRNLLPQVCSDSSVMDIENDCDFSPIDDEHLNCESIIPSDVNSLLDCQKPSRQPVETKKLRKKKQNQNKKQNKTVKDVAKPKKEVQEQCELCGKVFNYRSYLDLHLRTHTGDKPFSCSHCGHKFSLHNSLVSHLRIHSGDRPFICNICGKGFSQSAGLKSHIRAHTGEKPFECEICNKRFSQKSNLLMHKQIHTGQRDHVCTVCQKAFKFYKHLQSHMSLHSGKKQFKCSLCDKSFHRKNYLNNHLSIHTGERPYVCNVCGRAFSNSSNLRTHLRTHTGVKPYKCKVCKKAFSQSSALNRHMQQHSLCLPSNTVVQD